ncbi:hypothetical protein RchiOBHm_Chr2g0122101 [Rosa chinensis]|uniref:Uncharacterized protein n=1 Tax=Rosa chinensis TaxID=74649 RepID=A0A2P6RSQ2_ROSCH|nr:hypothetical protein RchiOBHm_Chr2g0122101 [Rosa chinensis]
MPLLSLFSFLSLNNRVTDVGLWNLYLLISLENRVKYTVVEVLNDD